MSTTEITTYNTLISPALPQLKHLFIRYLAFDALFSLQPGTFDLMGTIIYEIDQHPYQSIFYNGTIEVVEAGGFLSIESVFLFSLGIALVGLLGLWIYGQIQNFSKVSELVKCIYVEYRLFSVIN